MFKITQVYSILNIIIQSLIKVTQPQFIFFFIISQKFRTEVKYGDSVSIEVLLEGFGLLVVYILQQIYLLINYTFFREMIPKIDFYGKLPSFFEQSWLIIISLLAILSGIRFEFSSASTFLNEVLMFLQVVLYGLGTTLFMSELPFYSRWTQMSIGSIMLLSQYFITIRLVNQVYIKVSGFQSSSLDFHFFIIFLPFYLILIKLMFNYYNSIYIDGSNIKQLSYSQIIDIYKYGFYGKYIKNSSKKEIYKRVGILKAHTYKCKKNQCTCKMLWKIILNWKEEKFFQEESQSSIQTDQEELVNFINGNEGATSSSIFAGQDDIRDIKDDNTEAINEEFETQTLKLIKTIDEFILRTYAYDNNGNVFALFLYITWLIKKNYVPQKLLGALDKMKRSSSSFKHKYMYYYALKVMEKQLQIYYHHPEILFEENTSKANIQAFPSNFKELNTEMIDFNYAFEYKDNIEQLCSLIQKFIQSNTEYLIKIQMNEESPHVLFGLNQKLYDLSLIIQDKFEMINDRSLITDYFHLAPYFYFLKECLNRYKSASRIYNLHRQRIYDKKNIMNKQNIKFTNFNLYYEAFMLQVSLEKDSFARITDIFGDIGPLNIEKSEMIGTQIDDYQPSFRLDYHQRKVADFLNNEVGYIHGKIQQNVMIKIPTNDQLFSANICIKLIPDVLKGFYLVVGLRYVKTNSKMMILLDSKLKITNYTQNMAYMFGGFSSGIQTGQHISEVSSEILEQIQKEINRIKEIISNKKKQELQTLDKINKFKRTSTQSSRVVGGIRNSLSKIAKLEQPNEEIGVDQDIDYDKKMFKLSKSGQQKSLRFLKKQ